MYFAIRRVQEHQVGLDMNDLKLGVVCISLHGVCSQ
jgi:hypothetical protein